SWRDAVVKKIEAGQGVEDLANDLAEGADVLDRAAKLVPEDAQTTLASAAKALRDAKKPLYARVAPALDLRELLWQYPVRELVTATRDYPVWVDRERALFSAWYEFFPRSEGAQVDADHRPVKHGTFTT